VQSLSSQQVGCLALASAGLNGAHRRHFSGISFDLATLLFIILYLAN
jgi:hypothetical protein